MPANWSLKDPTMASPFLSQGGLRDNLKGIFGGEWPRVVWADIFGDRDGFAYCFGGWSLLRCAESIPKKTDEAGMSTDISIVIVTVCRRSLYKAIRSIFDQDFKGSIQLLVGADVEQFGNFSEMMRELETECPPHILMTGINPGYSTSKRHGGVHSSYYGGSLRTVLSFLSSSELVTYLDDDDWYEPQHLRLMHEAIQGKTWAFTLSNYADPNKESVLGIDTTESVGPRKGVYAAKFGGFVRPSALLLNKVRLSHILHLWSIAPFPSGDGEDRLIFRELLKYPDFGETRVATVNCAIDPADGMHAHRLSTLATPAKTSAEKFQSFRK